MEWTPTRVTYVMTVFIVCVLQMLAYRTNAKKIANYSIPGEQCNSGYIIDTGDQYEVYSANKVSENGTEVPTYTSDTNCALKFRAEKGQQILIRIVKFKLELSTKCTGDGLYLLDGVEDDAGLMTPTGYPLCGKSLSLPNYFTTSGNGVTIKFVSDAEGETDGFKMYVTPFTKPAKGEKCDDGRFMCTTSKKCITGDALCNGANQCEDGSDEPVPMSCPSAGARDARSPYSGLLFTLAFLTMYCLR